MGDSESGSVVLDYYLISRPRSPAPEHGFEASGRSSNDAVPRDPPALYRRTLVVHEAPVVPSPSQHATPIQLASVGSDNWIIMIGSFAVLAVCSPNKSDETEFPMSPQPRSLRMSADDC